MNIKNIFKKNQIIIFALAIMICIAGYLNFAKDSEDDKEQQNSASATYGEDLFADQEGDKLVDTDISDAETDISDLLVVNDPVNTESDLLATDPTGEQETTTQQDPASETSAPGEAVFVASNPINSSYFMSARLAREQQRAKSKANLMDIIENDVLAEESKSEAIDAVIEMNSIAEKENATEILLEAKGFSNAVVCIVDDSVDVIINSASLTDQDMAIIEDVVMRKTGVTADKLYITPVIAED